MGSFTNDNFVDSTTSRNSTTTSLPLPRLTRHLTEQPLAAPIPLRPLLGSSSAEAILTDATMTAHATISFAQPGVQAPVYVVTSLSSPPWDILELHAKKQEHGEEDLVFERIFEDVKEGTYQYKIRIGEGHWVVDESKETGMFLCGWWRGYVTRS